jgi:putative transposase
VYDEGEGKRSRTIFGFMALNGNDVVMVSDTAKAQDMISFLELVRKENPKKAIITILDNAKIHRAKATGKKADGLWIIMTFLPPYSPDLNPIELGWKDIKRELSGILQFDSAIMKAKPIALGIFDERRYSYSSYWVKKIINDKG